MIIHPDKALFAQANSLPAIPVCEHYAGSERLISKSFELQNEFGPIFDITCDLEDGAAAGDERRHATMVVDMLRSDANRFKQAGVRIHGPESGVWEAELDVVLTGVGDVVAYIT
ncbi:MAG: hypothetical protein KDD69_15625, partial [Bdellovibrionales bacterium]|nr:hypothetical protein [Bdellovibrionales bacterium]